MIFTLEDLAALRGGERDPIPVGELPFVVAELLKLRVPIVHLSGQSLRHINNRHADISDFDMLLLPLVVRQGLILRERKKRNVILAVYRDETTTRTYVAAMKYTQRACEVWLDSFYRLKPKEIGRVRRKTEVLREADI